MNKLISENENEVMVTISDCSHLIKYNNEKDNNNLQRTINATVNHELRNPLNSIVVFNDKNKQLIKRAENVYND